MISGILQSVWAEDIRYEQKIEDLAFGVSLYDFYQNNNLAAITAIESAKRRNQLTKRPQDAELLLGGLYFEYGLEQDAEFIFNNLLEEKLDTQSQNRVWFSLAKLHYAKNSYAQTQELLTRIEQKLSPQREAQKQHMLSNLYLQNNQLDDAIEAASKIPSDNIWMAYSRYNIGVSLLAEKKYKQSREWLTSLIQQGSEDEEVFALQDAANLALGMLAVRRQQPEQAVQYFAQIQLSSNLSNKALLGSGWAWSHQGESKKALAYWQALGRRKQTDIASQEAMLAIAQGIEKTLNKSLAIQVYEQVSTRYNEILLEMNNTIEGIQKGVLMNSLSSKMVVEDSSFDILDETLSQIPATPYLQPLFAREDFQNALQQYQELLTIQSTLGRWQKNLPALDLMLSERRDLFHKKRPAVEQAADFDQLTSLQQKRDALAINVLTIEQNKDYYALANEIENEYLEQLESVKTLINQLQSTQDMTEEKKKYRLLKGIISWQINIEFPRRFYIVKNELKQLNDALDEAGMSAQSLLNAATFNEQNLDRFNERISGQQESIDRLNHRLSLLIEQQQQQINTLAIAAIKNRIQQLEQLRIKARYSMALLQDELARKQGQ